MSDSLPWYCYICSQVVSVTESLECVRCGSDFVEIYDPSEHETFHLFNDPMVSIQQIVEELHGLGEAPQSSPSEFLNIFEERLRGLLSRRNMSSSSIASDRRNYVIGPELDDIITRILETEGKTNYHPAGEEFVKNLKPVKSQSNGDCSICLSKYKTGDEGIYFKCKHFFHYECAMSWLKVQNTCPNCRNKIDE
ncbi:hypothetical protein TCON_2639 [Astathelohania contejeani]|uniref:RING-type domain-containing protein n=1 Tax=Astathelohania contejeani TaxID=164912 RepID=A0ABQ7HVF7_9MICR|nr:hypothetical protein TCON_2639 [Thelohania contejeani]